MTPKQLKERSRLRTWIEIDTKAIAHNYKQVRKLLGKKTKILGVVKSNAYGHNLTEFSLELQKLGVDWLGVDSLIEGIHLRKAGVRVPILVLGHTLPVLYDEARKADITLTLSSMEMFHAMSKISKSKHPLKVHIKLDTGMHRQGFLWSEHGELIESLKSKSSSGRIEATGMYTHFAEAKEPNQREYTYEQLKQFEQWRNALIDAGFKLMAHASATAGAMLYESAHFDMVRIGISLYGLWPAKKVEEHMKERLTLKPALTWKAVVGETKFLKRGERIGYDQTELLMRDTVIAVIPVGYWHGFSRSISSKGRVLINGMTAKVLGRVSMDMIVVDVTGIPNVHMGTEVVLIGWSKEQTILLEELAGFAGTTAYELVTTLNPLIKKFYL